MSNSTIQTSLESELKVLQSKYGCIELKVKYELCDNKVNAKSLLRGEFDKNQKLIRIYTSETDEALFALRYQFIKYMLSVIIMDKCTFEEEDASAFIDSLISMAFSRNKL